MKENLFRGACCWHWTIFVNEYLNRSSEWLAGLQWVTCDSGHVMVCSCATLSILSWHHKNMDLTVRAACLALTWNYRFGRWVIGDCYWALLRCCLISCHTFAWSHTGQGGSALPLRPSCLSLWRFSAHRFPASERDISFHQFSSVQITWLNSSMWLNWKLI